MRSIAVTALLLGSTQALAAQGLGSITGFVRDSSGNPLPGAEVLLANQRALTSSQGGFRLDSLPVGNHLITIRLMGYAPLRSPVTVRIGVLHYNYTLRPATQQLPTVYAEVRRSGIYGTVGDTSYRPLAGVRVQVAGKGGGEAVTDSGGRFGFPLALRGQYVVRAVYPGYADERVFVEIKKEEGIEVAIRLRPSHELPSRADAVAIYDLGRRLAVNPPQDRLGASELTRYGPLGLCEVSRIANRIDAYSRKQDNVTFILNGTQVLGNMPLRALCAWRAAEVEFVEFGESVCRDATRTLVDLLDVWCTKLREDPRPNMPPGGVILEPRGLLRGTGEGRIRTQHEPGPFVVIWEKR